MDYIITGATGHIGNNIAYMLSQSGGRPKLLLRRSDDIALKNIDAVKAVGNLSDRGFLEENITRASTVIHCAGMIAITEKERDKVFDSNCRLTELVADVCADKGARIVYVSSVDAIYAEKDGIISAPNAFYPEKFDSCYAKSKAQASAYVLEKVKNDGLDGVIVCPSAVIGRRDYKISCVGQVIYDYIKHYPMARIDGGYNFVDVCDVARGVLSAAERGASGEVYLLCGEYMSVDKLFETLSKLLGRKKLPPKLPVGFINAFSEVGMAYYALRGRNPVFSRYALKTLGENRLYDCKKSEEQLGYTHITAEEAVINAANWMKDYIGGKA